MINSVNELNYNYAYALILLAKENNDLENCLKIFDDFIYLFNQDDNILKYLESYFVKLKDKFRLIDELLLREKIEYFSSFLKLLIRKHLIKNIHHIYREFQELANKNLGVLAGIIYSTSPLKKEKIMEFEKVFSAKKRAKISFLNKVDPTLIGGIKVYLDGQIYDDTIKHQLDSLKNSLLS